MPKNRSSGDLSATDQPPYRPLIRALLFGLAYALIIYGWTRWNAPASGMLVLGFLLGAPIAASGVAVAMNDPKSVRGAASHAGVSALTVTVMLVCAGVVLGEGRVCLVMAAPIFYGAGILGGILTGQMRKARAGRAMCLAFLVLPLIGVPLEIDQPPSAETHEVVTRIHVDAAPDAVWKRLTEVRDIAADEHRWSFSHDLVGVPRPVDARMDGVGVDAVRRVHWADGVEFEEHVSEWESGRTLAWTFRIGPDASRRILDEHLTVDSDYLRLEEGRYVITPASGGGSEVTLTTRYWIRTPMNAYASWWGDIFLGDFHRNVLTIIKRRAEAPA